jgi:membrane protein implicated in regulation of membrane protease activity
MGDQYAHRAGSRFFLHCALCAGGFLVVSAATAIAALWTSLGLPLVFLLGGVGIAGFAGYAYFLLRRFRVRCPQCEEQSARLARDTLNRQLLVCSECGYRAATGWKVLADSPFGH